MDLFEKSAAPSQEPLAYRMRPRTLDEFVGQNHIIGPGRLLRRAVQADQLSSVIFFGPPGTGKTTMARIIANTTQSTFVTLNAVLSGVKDIRREIEAAGERKNLYSRRTILFVDEVHRWNRSQQDALLPWVENGTFILIGATTENPYFEVNKALVSRSRVFQLTPLTEEDCREIGRAALTDPVRGYGAYSIDFEEEALDHLAKIANGDARSMLNAIELAVETTPSVFPPPPGETIKITMNEAEESIQKKAILYDKEGDFHFDIISAFIKSLRGSDPDAALYWLAKMVRAGEDPRFLFRRMLILAAEDVGLADPGALGVVESAAAAFDRVGLPEGRFHLAQAALYLATAKKSNSTLGFFDALSRVEEEQDGDVPAHLKDANRDKEGFGHGKGYLYPHAYKDHWVPQQYLPSSLQGRVFYHPSDQGYEKTTREEVLQKREAALETMINPDFDEILTFSPSGNSREDWLSRTLGSRDTTTRKIHDTIITLLKPSRHHRILAAPDGAGSLAWALLRRVPEGGVWVSAPEDTQRELLLRYGETMPEYERPIILPHPFGKTLKENLRDQDLLFEGIALENPFSGRTLPQRTSSEIAVILENSAQLLTSGGILVISDILPDKSQRLSSFVEKELGEKSLNTLKETEEQIYAAASGTVPAMEEMESVLNGLGLAAEPPDIAEYREERYIPEGIIDHWLNPSEKGSLYGKKVAEALGIGEFNRYKGCLTGKIAGKTVLWKRTARFIRCRKQR